MAHFWHWLDVTCTWELQEMHQLRRSLKAEVQASLADLRAMQRLQRELEEGQVRPLP